MYSEMRDKSVVLKSVLSVLLPGGMKTFAFPLLAGIPCIRMAQNERLIPVGCLPP